MRLEGKAAIVTGAASGIGRATAQVLAREAAAVVIGDINVEGVKGTAESIKKSGGRAVALKVDISNENDVKQMVGKCIAEFGRIDILANVAAYTVPTVSLFHEMDRQIWKAQTDITFHGTLRCCREVIPHMLSQKSGRIINVTSDAGKLGTPGQALYVACKGAIAAFSRTIARELGPYGITVNCVSPGGIETPPQLEWQQKDPKLAHEYASTIPLQRYGHPEEIANMILFLASEEGSYVTGQDYSVNGGLLM